MYGPPVRTYRPPEPEHNPNRPGPYREKKIYDPDKKTKRLLLGLAAGSCAVCGYLLAPIAAITAAALFLTGFGVAVWAHDKLTSGKKKHDGDDDAPPAPPADDATSAAASALNVKLGPSFNTGGPSSNAGPPPPPPAPASTPPLTP